MNDRAPIRDRTLALRILVPRLADRLREKMREAEDYAASQKTSTSSAVLNKNKPGGGNNNNTASGSTPDSYWDLDGVSCEPTTARNKTLWNFHCDGASYPAKLVNLPCPVEIHKTFDHASYYKCQDVAQLLIVYEDDYALEEAEEKPLDGFESYYHSGLTSPMKRVVERRFAAREHKSTAPPRSAVADVEEEILQLMKQLQKDEKASAANKRNKLPSLASTTKVLEEVEEVVVTYESWMDDGGNQPNGVEFDSDDPLATTHPEIFLSPQTIRELRDEDEEEQKKKQLELEKKEKARKEKKEKAANKKKEKDAAAAAPVQKKKGIASKKKQQQQAAAAAAAAPPVEEADEITQAANAALSADDLLGDLGGDDLFDDFDFGEDSMDM